MLSKLFLLLCWTAVLVRSIKNTPRRICYPQKPPDCKNSTSFTDAYPDLSRSPTGSRAATNFLLFTPENKDTPEQLQECGGHLPNNSNFKYRRTLIVIIHDNPFGFCDTAQYREMKNQLLLIEFTKPQVLAVDWSWGTDVDLGTAIENGKLVADQIVQVLKNILYSVQKKLRPIVTFHIIGDGLGAQIAGLVGSRIKNDKLLQRITALDPLRIGFTEDVSLDDRLDNSDAIFVEVYHSNMGNCLPSLGINYNAGVMDLYINGGKKQKGCANYALNSILKGDILFGINALVYPDFCSHFFAAEIFKVSINPHCCSFVGMKCDGPPGCQAGKHSDCSEGDRLYCRTVGYDSETFFYENYGNMTAQYYMNTSFDCPYCITDMQDLKNFTFQYKISQFTDGCNVTFNK